MYAKYIKRLLDIVLSLIAIIVLSPVYLIVAIVVRIQMGSPVLFSQDRIGKDEKVFKLYKFRSMTNEKDEKGKLLPEEKRLTKFGLTLRSTSLDELPELFSILKGDMSIVGPRPLPTYYGPYYLPEERKRHQVRGGLIPPDGLSKETTPEWETQFKYDNYYVDNVSFLLDCKVILVTFLILFKRVETQYGTKDRPHLNEYRAWMDKEKV
ncbi:sugar transferase [Spirochaetales bacterium NM-380-WT-3C1]|uniref:Sugar transferase n=1 Tax=Bullifex porci TaxID=2606638 RepID=A0A7X2PB16_9SPIO|nr:sugar transferase [Bullifex porci]MSU05581.1 sugar transferase [Bullifex porci]